MAAGLVCFDMDSTLADCEALDLLAGKAGREREVAKITKLAMEGKMDFSESLARRMEILKGVAVFDAEVVARAMPLMRGALEAVQKFKDDGFVVGMITGGFDVFAEAIAGRLGLDFYVANALEVKDGVLTGGYELKVNGNKGELLLESREFFGAGLTVAVGDGANDLSMLDAADIGVAFCPKPALEKMRFLKIRERDVGLVYDALHAGIDRRIKVVVDRTVHSVAARALDIFADVEVIDTNEMSEETVREVEVLVIRSNFEANRAFIDRARKLKIISTATSGVNHIDIPYAKERGIRVFSARGENAHSVADYVFRMLLYATDDVFYTNFHLKQTHDFKRIKRENERFELKGRTMGIVGLGRVGSCVRDCALGFGMYVKAYDPFVPEAKNTLEEVMKCDVVSVHCELTPGTKYMIERKQLEMMKKDAIFINVSRGPIVREDDLYDVLKAGRIRLAIVDVFEKEPEYSKLYDLENAIVTPHIAGNSVESRINAAKRVTVEIIGCLYDERRGKR